MTIMYLTDTAPATIKNTGDRKEYALATTFGKKWEYHNDKRYDRFSDIENMNGHNISVKSDSFTLMSGSLTEGRDNLDDILSLYLEKTHSDTAAYITADYKAFIMNMSEFAAFIRKFGRVFRESAKNGGAYKIRMLHESKKMVKWLECQAT